MNLVVFSALVFLLLIWGIYRFRILQEANKKLRDGEHDEALLLSLKVRDWLFGVKCLEEIENTFTTVSFEQAIRNIEAMVKVGEHKRARRMLFLLSKERKDGAALLQWYWRKVN